MLDIAAGVSHLHQSGFNHGDIAARNAFLGAEYRAKIGDFGLTKKFDETKKYGRLDSAAEVPLLVRGKLFITYVILFLDVDCI